MSQDCAQVEIPVELLDPKWVEFTETKGMLRVLRSNEEEGGYRARGMIFNCPRCMKDRNKKHYCIFLFPNAPKEARPHGRFVLSNSLQTVGFSSVTLKQFLNESSETRNDLHPQDLPCRWTGSLLNGVVRWRPNWFERSKTEKILR